MQDLSETKAVEKNRSITSFPPIPSKILPRYLIHPFKIELERAQNFQAFILINYELGLLWKIFNF